MGLSEREQQLLDEMERRLYQSEADVLHAVPNRVRLNLRSLVLGIVIALAGLAVVVIGVAMQQMWLGLVGFVVMLGGTLLAVSKREQEIEATPTRGSRDSAPAGRESLSERLERRWDQRMEGER